MSKANSATKKIQDLHIRHKHGAPRFSTQMQTTTCPTHQHCLLDPSLSFHGGHSLMRDCRFQTACSGLGGRPTQNTCQHGSPKRCGCESSEKRGGTKQPLCCHIYSKIFRNNPTTTTNLLPARCLPLQKHEPALIRSRDNKFGAYDCQRVVNRVQLGFHKRRGLGIPH